MCGISGIVSFNETQLGDHDKKLNIMNAITKHRGPDSTDVSLSENSALGVNRLAIVGINDRSSIYQTSDFSAELIYTGEIVNAEELTKRFSLCLGEKKCDGAVLAPLFEKNNAMFVDDLAGMFAIAIYDKKNRELHLIRDPAGIKPLYYTLINNSVYFSSEIKAIQAVMVEPADIDFNAINNIVRYRFNVGDKTVFPEISRVLPGQYLRISHNQIKAHFYSQNKADQSRKQTVKDAQRKGNSKIKKLINIDFSALFRAVVLENTKSDVKGGVFVSGGVDSSAIASIIAKHDTKFKTLISLKFEMQRVNDEIYARQLEDYLETKFEWVSISSEDARKSIEEIVFYLDEPLENPTHVGTYMMAKKASELGVKTVVTGDGADEYFLGYERFDSLFGNQIDRTFSKYTNKLWSLAPTLFEELYTPKAHALVKPLLDPRNKKILPFQSIEGILRLEQTERLPEYHCMRLDRMTMAWGVEARVPFLDRRIIEYANHISPSVRYGENGKGWLKKMVSPFLPASILGRKKDFFPSLPCQWIREGGTEWVAGILLDKNAVIANWFNQSTLELWLNRHRKNEQDYGRILWAATVLELWLKAQKLRFASAISNH